MLVCYKRNACLCCILIVAFFAGTQQRSHGSLRLCFGTRLLQYACVFDVMAMNDKECKLGRNENELPLDLAYMYVEGSRKDCVRVPSPHAIWQSKEGIVGVHNIQHERFSSIPFASQ